MNMPTRFLLNAAAVAAAMLASGCSKPQEVAPAAPAASAPAGAGNGSDTDVTEDVKTVLEENDMLTGFDITVVTLKGDVRVTGQVNNQAQIDEVAKIVRASEGAHTIHNELTLKK